MNLKLHLATIWLPSFFVKKELDRVAEVTVGCLDTLLKKYDSDVLKTISQKKLVLDGNVAERRRLMATAHELRVKALIDALGYEEAMNIGRNSLFKAGLKLGREARKQLGVGSSLQELVMAARVLYKILGIEFEIKQGAEVLMIVNKCCLSKYYSPETCMLLSAADEGVVQGLNEKINMKFTQRMTEGPSECLACIYSV